MLEPAATYWSYWGLREAPFRVAADSQTFHLSPTHEEALARLHFLVENRRPVGLLCGERGSGKTLVLHRFARELRRAGVVAAVVPAFAAGVDEVLGSIMAGLALGPGGDESVQRRWARIADRLLERRYQQVSTVFLCDDADHAPPESLALVSRLLQLDAAPEMGLTVVLASDTNGMVRLGSRLLEQVELRVELEPWTAEETVEYVERSLAQAGRRESVFEERALERLYELSAGQPRRVGRLADLALLAAAGQERRSIDEQTINAVARELTVELSPTGSRTR